MGEESQADMVRKVQSLWAKADHPNTSETERDAFVAKARKLMAKYAIDEMVLSNKSNGHEEIIMADILLYEEGDEDDSLVPDQRMALAHIIARANRCKDIITDKDASIYADGSAQLAGCYMLVYGFRSDVKMVELLYTNLMTDMILGFHRAKLGHVKKEAQRKNIMVNFCVGFVRRIGTRLNEINQTVHEMAESDGSLLPVLRSRELAVQDKFDQLYPPQDRVVVPVRGYKSDANAQAAGAAAAESADLGGKAVGGRKEALGS